MWLLSYLKMSLRKTRAPAGKEGKQLLRLQVHSNHGSLESWGRKLSVFLVC